MLRNNGSGTFAPQVTYPVGSNPQAVTLADATLDSKPDILAFGHNSTITVLPGKGNGIFLFLDYPVGKNLRDGLAVDITGDHKPDLIAADDNDGTNGLLDVLLNDGSGGFAPAAGSPIILPGVPQALAAADFTRDSKTDLAVSAFDGNTFTMTVRVLTGNGTGGFTAGAPLPLSANISPGPVLGTADLGNGHPDLVVGETVFNSSAGALDILFDDGHGSFTLKTPIALSAAPQALAIADLGNGHADLAVSLADGTVALFRGDGNGGFTAIGSPITVGTNAGSVALADVNGDNTADLIVASASSDSSLDTASVRLGNGDGTFRAPVALPADPNVPVMRFDDVTYHDALVVADLNLDGVPDIAVLNACSSECPNVSLYHGNGDGTFTVAATYEVGWAGRTHIIRAADLDGDGHTDLATVGQNGSISVSGGMMGVLRNATIPASAATHLVFAASPPPSVAAGKPFAVTVAAEDASGNIVNGFAGQITLTLNGGSGFGGTLTQPASGGMTLFQGLTIASGGAGLTLTASSGALTGVSSTFIVTAPANPLPNPLPSVPAQSNPGALPAPRQSGPIQGVPAPVPPPRP